MAGLMIVLIAGSVRFEPLGRCAVIVLLLMTALSAPWLQD
jgi:hypothetical protein